MSRFLTIGHSTRSIEDFLSLLEAHGATGVVDVRRYPGSRRHPQFGRDALAGSLDSAGIAYAHMGVLGGRRTPSAASRNTGWRNEGFRGYADYMATAEFADALDRLEELAFEFLPAIMCAEAVPWQCHRQLIADALTARGHLVEHILSAARLDPHKLHPMARIEGGVIFYPGLEAAGS